MKNEELQSITPVEIISFARKVSFGESAECWPWTAARTSHGYGAFYCRGQIYMAHRVSYFIHKGALVEGMHLDHLCRNPCCVNPLHLEQVTPRENILRGVSPSSQQAKWTHCKYGHALSGDNLVMQTRRGIKKVRRCRICLRAYQNKRDAARKIERKGARSHD